MPSAVEFTLVAANAPGRTPTAGNLHAAVTTALALDGHREQEQPFAVWPVLPEDDGPGLVLRVGWLPDSDPPAGLTGCRGWRFGPLHAQTRTVTTTRITYEQLAAAKPGRHISVQLVSPMLFSHHGVNVHLPTPWLMWRSLLHRWNRYCPPELAWDAREVEAAAGRVHVERFELTSRDRVVASTPDGRGGFRERRMRGCVGWMDVRPDNPTDSRLLTPLAGFAEVAGIGYMTTHGFGAVTIEVN